jgi:NAD(P)H-dependent FMN reductase
MANGRARSRRRRRAVKVRILCFAGSLRKHSLNKKLARVAGGLAMEHGAEVTFVDLNDLPMPLYDQDLEDVIGIPENACKFRELLKQHDAFLIASPEYNGSYSAVLKNAIDWASRQAAGEKNLACFEGKVAALLAASPGGKGGVRGLSPLRLLLSDLRVLVIPQQLALANADSAFNEAGALADEKQIALVRSITEQLVATTRALLRG